jgi:GH18 family chitinase
MHSVPLVGKSTHPDGSPFRARSEYVEMEFVSAMLWQLSPGFIVTILPVQLGSGAGVSIGLGKIFTIIPTLKQRNPNLQVWASIRGWTFNDNNTIWQPVFGDAASSFTKQRKFASKVTEFLHHYGFDGVGY